ncbi:SNF7 family protein [Thecamonas trahens ATCC 50062]|uniref:SNF7 family protein n=1 Tax=Thecamonas trahens ATCC 50062 TaxID=461836 RepID=A0A0L0DLE3_THETB|nr:SNF7 family protein [Thecamonas trahens ATCC 50062]KNC53159.1 SNF7 family protein [Thecamonas trahens ATCC 50062]|eukprot:XP_013754632.1 SNF7 family protein [Thecamonas trahens ATCC 50062]
MGGVFGKKKDGDGGNKSNHNDMEITAHDRAVLDLKNQRDKLGRQKKKMAANMDRLQGMAMELVRSKQKTKALLVLKKKKVIVSNMEKIESMLDNVQELVDSLEFAARQAEVFDSLRTGADALKDINAQMDIDEVERIMDDTQEAIEYQNELSNALAGILQPGEEEDLEAELDALILDEAADMPSVPVAEPGADGIEEYSYDSDVGVVPARSSAARSSGRVAMEAS